MIRIGFNSDEKQAEIERYLRDHEIKQAFVFYPEVFPLTINTLSVPVDFIEYRDIIEYKPFYHLLEVVDPSTLLIFNECLRTQKRSDLTYNCAHHYANQTPHVMVFEHFPFIEDVGDFMILLDFQTPGKYKGRSFDYQYLRDEDVKVITQKLSTVTINMTLSEEDIQKYEKKKNSLFKNIGNGDPDTIPRQLHIFAGDFKKKVLVPGLNYVARNDRFKLPNVTVYRSIEPKDYTVIDFPHRRIDFNDFLKKTKMTDVHFINSGLKVDSYYLRELKDWIRRLEDFYVKASLY